MSALHTYAIALLTELERKDRYVKTPELMRACSIPETILPTIAGILKQLTDMGVLSCIKGKPASWCLVSPNWNKVDPFNGEKPKGVNYYDSKPKEPKPTPPPIHYDSNFNEVKTEQEPATSELNEIQSLKRRVTELEDIDLERVKSIKKLNDNLTEAIRHKISMSEDITKLQTELETVKKIASSSVREIVIKKQTPDGTKVKRIKDVVLPSIFDDMLSLAQARRNILLVGPAGCGKTHSAKLVADSLGLNFGSISCSGGMSEAHLSGKSVPNISKGISVFQSTEFLQCYEEGGLFLLDELDAADGNVLLVLNSAIDQGYFPVANRSKQPRAERHPDFVLVATANTFGRGASRMYMGRNQLDEATLSRFHIGTIDALS